MPVPTISAVDISEEAHDNRTLYGVTPVWDGVDRSRIGGWVLTSRPLAERLRRAVLAGVVYHDVTVGTDVNGQTYAHCSSRVLGRRANADLKRLGY